jgi:hypothetical protein
LAHGILKTSRCWWCWWREAWYQQAALTAVKMSFAVWCHPWQKKSHVIGPRLFCSNWSWRNPKFTVGRNVFWQPKILRCHLWRKVHDIFVTEVIKDGHPPVKFQDYHVPRRFL